MRDQKQSLYKAIQNVSSNQLVLNKSFVFNNLLYLKVSRSVTASTSLRVFVALSSAIVSAVLPLKIINWEIDEFVFIGHISLIDASEL